MMGVISGPSLRRLPQYLKLLTRLVGEGQVYVTSAEVARQLKLDETLVRKDLSVTGFTGKPRVGFEIETLKHHLEGYLGLQMTKEAFLVGVGRLGQALTHYPGFERYGLRFAGLFDNNPDKIGQVIAGVEVMPLWKAPALARKLNVRIAVLTVPAHAAQPVADLLADAGMLAFWNFSGHPVHMPDPIVVQNEDLADSLAVFSHKVIRQLEAGK